MYCAGYGDIGWADDFPYSHMPLPGGSEPDFFDCKGPPITAWGQVPEAFAEHFRAVNGRAIHIFSFTIALVPARVLCLLHTLAFAGMFSGLMRLAFGYEWRRHYLALIILIILGWLTLPWHDNLASADYFMNYVWASALNLIFLSLVLYPPKKAGKISSGKTFLCVLGAAAAMMHEGMSVAISASLLWIVFKRKGRDSLPLYFYMLFSLVPILSPALWQLADRRNQTPFSAHFFKHTIGADIIIVYIAALITCLKSWKKRHIGLERIVIWSCVAVTLALSFISHQGGRALWLAIALSLASLLSDARMRIPAKVKQVSSVVLSIGLLLWMSLLCAWQYHASMERNRLMALLAAGKTPVVTDLTEPEDMPWLLLHTVSHVNGDETIRSNIAAHLYGDAYKPLPIIPRSWQKKGLENLPLVAGNIGARTDRNFLFLSPRPIKTAILTHNDKTGNPGAALNPLREMLRMKNPMPTEEVRIECERLSEDTWLCRPLNPSPVLAGFPVTRIDSCPP